MAPDRGAEKVRSMNSSQPRPSSRILHSARQLAGTALGLLQTRLALAGIELEEEIQRFIALLLLAFGLVIFVGLGLLVLTLSLVMAFREEERLVAMALLGILYLLVGAGFGLFLRHSLAQRAPIFEATLAELEKDRLALKPVLGNEAPREHPSTTPT
jgi:uncharacterized membrane protein YqjE